MLVLAARQLRLSTALATGSWPITSPPVSAGGFPCDRLNGQDVVYVCAHGLAGGNMLYGDGGVPFLSASQIRASSMPGAIVYLAGCYGLGALSEAFLAAGADAVVADRDVNWSGALWPSGSNLLGWLFLRGLRRGMTAGEALAYARERYWMATRGLPRDAELLASVSLSGAEGARWHATTTTRARDGADIGG